MTVTDSSEVAIQTSKRVDFIWRIITSITGFLATVAMFCVVWLGGHLIDVNQQIADIKLEVTRIQSTRFTANDGSKMRSEFIELLHGLKGELSAIKIELAKIQKDTLYPEMGSTIQDIRGSLRELDSRIGDMNTQKR